MEGEPCEEEIQNRAVGHSTEERIFEYSRSHQTTQRNHYAFGVFVLVLLYSYLLQIDSFRSSGLKQRTPIRKNILSSILSKARTPLRRQAPAHGNKNSPYAMLLNKTKRDRENATFPKKIKKTSMSQRQIRMMQNFHASQNAPKQ